MTYRHLNTVNILANMINKRGVRMQNMNYYYDFSGQKFGYPLSLSINSFDRQVFSRQNSLEISYVLKGEYQAITEHFTSHIKEGELVIIAPNDIHMIVKKSPQENVILTLHIDFSHFPNSMIGNVEELFVSMACTNQENTKVLKKLKKKVGELIKLLLNGENNLLQMNMIMMELVNIASSHQQYSIEQLPLLSDHHENYMKAIRYIDKYYHEDLHLKDIAKTLSFSTSYTSKLFKKYTGIPFIKYLAYVRIRASLESLLEGKESIEKIASDCGMPNSKAYTTTFKEMYGITPSTYRKRFIRNMKFNPENIEQKMKFDDKQKFLLQHLIEDNYPILYEDNTIKIVKEKEDIICRISKNDMRESVITYENEELIIKLKKI